VHRCADCGEEGADAVRDELVSMVPLRIVFVVASQRTKVVRNAAAEPRTTSAEECTESASVSPSSSSRAPDSTRI
jgi:hypothetical protein